VMQKLTIISVWLFISAFSSIAFGNECIKCHQENAVEESEPRPSPIFIKAKGKTRSVSLADAFKQDGAPCPGITTAYRAMQYGIKLLYGDTIPEQGDLVVFSRTPVPGSRDFLDLLLYDKKKPQKTAIPEDMPAGSDKFFYTVYSKSMSTAVDVQLTPQNWPNDFFKLKKKQKSKILSPEEWDILHGYMKNIILTFQTMPLEELFGKPVPYKVIMWENKKQ
jgi:hypothetical protein